MPRYRAFSHVGFAVTSLVTSVACSGVAEQDRDTVPDFVGTPSVAGSAGAQATNDGANTSPTGTGVVSNPESGPGNVPVNTGANVGANAGATPTANTGGAAMTSPVAPGSGAGGSAMAAAAGNGGQPSASPPAPPVDDGPAGTGCAPGAAFFCEDFEAFNVGVAQTNALWRPEGTATIDDQTVQGTRSLHLQAGGGQASRIFVQGFAPPNNSFFGRMNVFVEQFPTGPAYAHFVMVEATGQSGERVRPIGGQFIPDVGNLTMWGVGSDGGATGDWTAWRETALTANGRWLCMEWEMDAAANSVDVRIDGVLKPELSVSTTSHDGNGNFIFPTFNNIWLGWTVFQGGTTPPQFNVYLDDIVLSTERVGCP
jgi:hypothetical protein